MKIDPRILSLNDSQPDRVKGANNKSSNASSPAKTIGVSPANGEDRVSLSTAHGEVQTLTAQLANVPEVRTDRVTALQQRVQNGQYKPDSQKVADAMIAQQSAGAKRA
jgi:negative regulator of flagellin synthesis FlgM